MYVGTIFLKNIYYASRTKISRKGIPEKKSDCMRTKIMERT